MPRMIKAKRSIFTPKMAATRSSLNAGNGGMRMSALHSLQRALSYALSRTMAIGSAARWARSGCTKSSDEHGETKKKAECNRGKLHRGKCILGTNTRVKGHLVHALFYI